MITSRLQRIPSHANTGVRDQCVRVLVLLVEVEDEFWEVEARFLFGKSAHFKTVPTLSFFLFPVFVDYCEYCRIKFRKRARARHFYFFLAQYEGSKAGGQGCFLLTTPSFLTIYICIYVHMCVSVSSQT